MENVSTDSYDEYRPVVRVKIFSPFDIRAKPIDISFQTNGKWYKSVGKSVNGWRKPSRRKVDRAFSLFSFLSRIYFKNVMAE